jgi:exodeoxyribonuclease V alpha subunit
MVRVRAGISYALTEAMDEGHCGLPTEELIPLAEKLLEVLQELISTALDLELHEGTVVADRVSETPCVFLAGLHRAERTIAERLMRLANGKLPWPSIDPDKALPWVEGRIGRRPRRPNSRRRGSKAARNSSIPTAKPTPKLSVKRTRKCRQT